MEHGDTISPMEDFIIVHLQRACTLCCGLMISGNCFECNHCKSFQLCDKCFETEQKLEDRERHLINQKDNHILHPSEIKEVPHDTKDEDENLESEVFNLRRVSQLRNTQDLLVHGSQCRDPHCQYPNCRKVKELFHHGTQCKIQVPGGCLLCKKMWFLLNLHARSCKESECNFPRCRDLKERMQQSDSRRRDAVMEMMKQRAKDFAGGSW